MLGELELDELELDELELELDELELDELELDELDELELDESELDVLESVTSTLLQLQSEHAPVNSQAQPAVATPPPSHPPHVCVMAWHSSRRHASRRCGFHPGLA